MSYEARVLAHSVGPYQGTPPLITMRMRYPRILHAEELTHRVLNTSPEQVEILSVPDGLMYDRNLSRNASSSRAIPTLRMIESIREDPAEPIYWGKNRPGMQATEELTGWELDFAKDIWRANRDQCIADALELHRIGAHKQLVNRLVENHGHINVVVTATNWSNFFALRRHKDAQPEIKHLADLVWQAQQESTPRVLVPGAWHLPYVDEDDDEDTAALVEHLWKRHKAGEFSEGAIDGLVDVMMVRLSVSRCARTSYLTTDGRRPTVEEDLALYDRLVGSLPLHASPAEHQARPDIRIDGCWEHPELHGNLEGYVQFRKTLPDEYIRD